MKIKNSILSLISLLWLFNACHQHDKNMAVHRPAYTCTMHPKIRQDKPGACPICNMTLTAMKMPEPLQTIENSLSISVEKQFLAGIKTDTLSHHFFSDQPYRLGVVSINPIQTEVIATKVKGRIEKLYVKISGQEIKKGMPLFEIYSESLSADIKTLLMLNKYQDEQADDFANQTWEAAKNKLLLWGLNKTQIEKILNQGYAESNIIFYASNDGYVFEMNVAEGEFVEEGAVIMKTTDLSKVWISVQVYANEIINLDDYHSFYVISPAYPNKIFKAHKVHHQPNVSTDSKIKMLHIEVENSDFQLLPGMMTEVYPHTQLNAVLSIPKSALTAHPSPSVWVKYDETSFVQKKVVVGMEDNHWMEIVSGLSPNDQVVIEGSYLLQSEFILSHKTMAIHQH